jgi:hypothetical protein
MRDQSISIAEERFGSVFTLGEAFFFLTFVFVVRFPIFVVLNALTGVASLFLRVLTVLNIDVIIPLLLLDFTGVVGLVVLLALLDLGLDLPVEEEIGHDVPLLDWKD